MPSLDKHQDEVALRRRCDPSEQIVGRPIGPRVIVDRPKESAIGRGKRRAERGLAFACADQRLDVRSKRVPSLGAHLAVLENAKYGDCVAWVIEIRRKPLHKARVGASASHGGEDENDGAGRTKCPDGGARRKHGWLPVPSAEAPCIVNELQYRRASQILE